MTFIFDFKLENINWDTNQMINSYYLINGATEIENELIFDDVQQAPSK